MTKRLSLSLGPARRRSVMDNIAEFSRSLLVSNESKPNKETFVSATYRWSREIGATTAYGLWDWKISSQQKLFNKRVLRSVHCTIAYCLRNTTTVYYEHKKTQHGRAREPEVANQQGLKGPCNTSKFLRRQKQDVTIPTCTTASFPNFRPVCDKLNLYPYPTVCMKSRKWQLISWYFLNMKAKLKTAMFCPLNKWTFNAVGKWGKEIRT